MTSKGSYGTKARMLPGDFHLRRDDRQMFGNYIVLSAAGGEGGGIFAKVRKSATFVETPVYEVPKLWKLDISFDSLGSSPVFPLSPWVPSALGASTLRVTVRHAMDRDKLTTTEVFDLRGLTQAPNLQSAMPQRFFTGLQVAVTAEISGGGSAPIGVQVSLVEVTAIDRDPYRNAITNRFAQSTLTANFLLPNEKRRQFFVENWGSTPLYLAFDFFAVGPGAAAHYAIALPNRGDIYESPRDCFQGYVSGIWEANAAIATDQALVTEGF